MTILLCLCFYSLYYHFVNLNFICINNLYIRLSFHFTYNTDEEIIDFEIYLWIISNDEEAVAQRCSIKKVPLEISQNSQENTCARVSFLIKLQLY